MKRYLFMREIPLSDFTILPDYLNSILPGIEIQAISYNSIKVDEVQKYEVILETEKDIDDNLYINIGLLIDDFESEMPTLNSPKFEEIQEEIETIDKVNMYKSLSDTDRENLLTTLRAN